MTEKITDVSSFGEILNHSHSPLRDQYFLCSFYLLISCLMQMRTQFIEPVKLQSPNLFSLNTKEPKSQFGVSVDNELSNPWGYIRKVSES